MSTTYLKATFRTEALYEAYRPSANLSPFIHEYWIMHLDKVAGHNKMELELPKTHPEIIFKYGEDYEELHIKKDKKSVYKTSSISGVISYAKASKRVNTSNPLLMIGIKFKPYGMYALLNQPLYQFYNENIPLADLNKPKLIELEEKLFYAENRTEILAILNKEFEKAILNNNLDSQTQSFLKAFDLFSSNKLSNFIKDKPYNYKYIERKFKTIVGANPSQYFKIKRFNNFYKDMLSLGKFKYIDLVYKHNYYDQNHLIKDFKSVMHLSPNKFLKKSKTQFTQHITKTHLDYFIV